MNIFKVLSRGHGRVSETNVSAFLGFLLDPNEQHGLGKEFLSRFIEVVNNKLKETNDNEVLSSLYVNKKISKKLVQNFNIDVKIEKTYDDKRIDLDLYFQDRENKLNNVRFGIELKINDEAITEKQLQNYYSHLAEKEGNKVLIFLALNSDKSNNVINGLVTQTDGPQVVFITWEDIVTLITTILNKHNQGEIDPIHLFTIQLLISFKQFILSNFRDDADPEQMKYIVSIDGEAVIFENSIGRTILEICNHYNVQNHQVFKSLTKLNSKGITNNKYFIANEVDYNNHLSSKTEKRRRYFESEDEVMLFEDVNYYLTTQFSISNLKKFEQILKNNMNLNIAIDIK